MMYRAIIPRVFGEETNDLCLTISNLFKGWRDDWGVEVLGRSGL